MAIEIFATKQEADAVPGPKQLWIDIDRYVVYTGDDMGQETRNATISVQQFRDRFTSSETDAFIAASRTDDNVAKLQFKLSTAQEPLYLDSQALQQGMLYLVAVGVITESRRIEILA